MHAYIYIYHRANPYLYLYLYPYLPIYLSIYIHIIYIYLYLYIYIEKYFRACFGSTLTFSPTVPLGAVPVLSWCGGVSLEGKHHHHHRPCTHIGIEARGQHRKNRCYFGFTRDPFKCETYRTVFKSDELCHPAQCSRLLTQIRG